MNVLYILIQIGSMDQIYPENMSGIYRHCIVTIFYIYIEKKKDCRIFSGGYREGTGGSLELPFDTKLFNFHGKIYLSSAQALNFRKVR